MNLKVTNPMLSACCFVMLLCATAIAKPPASAPASPATRSSAATRPSPDQEMVSISFRDAPVDQLFIFISEKTGKPVIPQDSVKQKRITVVSSKQQTLSEAMQIIAEALRQNGIIMEESPRVINMKSLADAKQSLLAVIPPEQSVLTLPNKAAVVHKLFELRYFDVGKMKDVVLPMLPDFGQVMADPNTRQLMVTDTVEDLARIEQIIQSLDVEQAEQTIKKIIIVKQGDASDIVATVRVLIASSLSSQARDVVVSGGRGGGGPSGPSGGGGPSSPSGPSGPDNSPGGGEGRNSGAGSRMHGGPGGPGGPGAPGVAASGVFLEENKVPVVLMADVQRNWIIAVASKRMMDMIDEWVAKLDIPAAASDRQFDVLELKHADMDDVSRQISQVIDAMPAGDARQSVRLVPFAQSRKILVTGSKRGRDMVRDLIAQLDQEAGNQSMRVFQLVNADAEDVAQDIEELYGGKKDSGGYGYFSDYFSSRSRGNAPQRVKVTADTRRNAIIVISDTAMLEEIQKLLKEQWDLPLSDKESQPKIYTLKHVDPVKLKDMLEELFYKKKTRRSDSGGFYDYIMDLGSSHDDQPVGRLYGQFRFQAMADSNRLLVVAKNTASYAVMDALISQLDQPEDAGAPQMIELKHANAEDLAEQLNATLAEPGTLAEILRAKRDLAGAGRQNGLPPSARSGDQNNTANAANAQAQQQGSTSPNVMTFWWQRAPRRIDEKPTSNLIGKIRFVPINRRNALLVVAPQAYLQPIHELVEELDQPGMQVMIHAIIAEVQSDDTSTLGIRLASDPSIFKDPRLMDSSIGGGGNLTSNNIITGTPGATHNNAVFTANLNVNVLLQLLIHNFGLKILFEPKLYTADNQEAEFFDGQDVPFQTQAQSSPEGATVVQSFNYTPVGTYLRIRPHITNEKDVDLTINLQLSSIVPGETSFGNFIFDRRETTTHVVIGDGETVMLSGIIRQELSKDVRKIPLLGDIPLIGSLFRSTDTARNNRELIAFITPHVIRRENEPAAANSYRQWIQNLRQELNAGKAPPSTSPTPEEKPASHPAAP
jgi:general secretion pathway protein D